MREARAASGQPTAHRRKAWWSGGRSTPSAHLRSSKSGSRPCAISSGAWASMTPPISAF